MIEQHGEARKLLQAQGLRCKQASSHDRLTFGQVPRHGLHQRSEAGDSSNRHGGDGGSDAAIEMMLRTSLRGVESGIDAAGSIFGMPRPGVRVDLESRDE